MLEKLDCRALVPSIRLPQSECSPTPCQPAPCSASDALVRVGLHSIALPSAKSHHCPWLLSIRFAQPLYVATTTTLGSPGPKEILVDLVVYSSPPCCNPSKQQLILLQHPFTHFRTCFLQVSSRPLAVWVCL